MREAYLIMEVVQINKKTKGIKLPDLEGTSEQVKEALEIRSELLEEYKKLREHFVAIKDNPEDRQRLLDTLLKVFDLLHSKEAKFFLEHKSLLDLLEYRKIVTIKKSSIINSFEGDLFAGADAEEDVFKDNEEYRFD